MFKCSAYSFFFWLWNVGQDKSRHLRLHLKLCEVYLHNFLDQSTDQLIEKNRQICGLCIYLYIYEKAAEWHVSWDEIWEWTRDHVKIQNLINICSRKKQNKTSSCMDMWLLCSQSQIQSHLSVNHRHQLQIKSHVMWWPMWNSFMISDALFNKMLNMNCCGHSVHTENVTNWHFQRF